MRPEGNLAWRLQTTWKQPCPLVFFHQTCGQGRLQTEKENDKGRPSLPARAPPAEACGIETELTTET